ncbi:MAG TPA: hypothetical protein VMT55_04210, partial [Candidatus Sulfotelmatobacter sp.]|nr:hypothetical protein [Candidatus Sulfotelmatobacter sp.]
MEGSVGPLSPSAGSQKPTAAQKNEPPVVDIAGDAYLRVGQKATYEIVLPQGDEKGAAFQFVLTTPSEKTITQQTRTLLFTADEAGIYRLSAKVTTSDGRSGMKEIPVKAYYPDPEKP